jgi:predicted peroxiredoxin
MARQICRPIPTDFDLLPATLFHTLPDSNQERSFPMSDSIAIALSCGTDNPNRATRAFFFAATAKKEDKNVTVFLLDEGVYLAKEGIAQHVKAATGDSLDDHLSYLQEYDVPILVCTPCAVSRQITEADLIQGARFAKGAELIELACKGPVLSL